MPKVFNVEFYTLKQKKNWEYYVKDAIQVASAKKKDAKKAVQHLLESSEYAYKLGDITEVKDA